MPTLPWCRPVHSPILAALAAATLAMAEPAPAANALQQRADQVAGWVRATPAGVADALTPAFLAAVPESAVVTLISQLHAQVGACRDAVLQGQASAGVSAGVFRMDCASGGSVEFELQVEAAAPHRIAGLRLRPVQPAASVDLAAALRGFEAFGAEAGVIVATLGDGAPQVRAGHNAAAPLHIASVVKLCTLSALLQAVADGLWRWDTVLQLHDTDRSLPSGALGSWPSATPLTLQTLLVLLLSDSDNTANDLLLRALAERGRWPAARDTTLDAVSGVPVLRTRQYFTLRALPVQAQAWVTAAPDARAALLRSLPAWPLEMLAQQFATQAASTPATTGWSASAMSLLPLLQRLERQLAAETAAPARAVFASLARRDPSLAGFDGVVAKGGSDHGVLAWTLVLQRGNAPPLAVVALWNGATAAPPAGWQLALQQLLAVLQRTTP